MKLSRFISKPVAPSAIEPIVPSRELVFAEPITNAPAPERVLQAWWGDEKADIVDAVTHRVMSALTSALAPIGERMTAIATVQPTPVATQQVGWTDADIERLASAVNRRMPAIADIAVEAEPVAAAAAQAEPDLRDLAEAFLKEVLVGVQDKARRSTYKSAFDYWWTTMGDATFPHENNIKSFGLKCRSSASEEYALARQRVMRKFREWLEARGIKHAPPPRVKSQAQAEDTQIAGSGMSTTQLVSLVRDAMFGGEPSEDYWATLVRHVAAEIGAKGIAKMCHVDEEMAERWIQLRKIPKNAREQLEYAHLLIRIRQAKAENNKDLDDLWDESLEIEGFLVSGLSQDGY